MAGHAEPFDGMATATSTARVMVMVMVTVALLVMMKVAGHLSRGHAARLAAPLSVHAVMHVGHFGDS
jgi:hypothetical protein